MKALKNKSIISCTILLVTLLSFKAGEDKDKVSYMAPVAIIYKTKADYSKNVPVTLSEDKSKIVSYPAPQDVYFRGVLAYPTQLARGFLLDNRGITVNSAFLKLTYEEYSKLGQVPSTDDLYKLIIDKDPITEMINLGTRRRFTNETEEINRLIEKHKLKEFKKLK